MNSLLLFIFFTSDEKAWVWAILGALVGVYIFYRGFRVLGRERLILNTPTSKVRSASMGLVEVNGLAAGPYTMSAPITAQACYYYRTMAWEWKQSGKNKEWVKVADESLHVPFYLDDGTGRVLVNPQGAELDIHRDFHEEYRESFFSSGPDLPLNVSSFLARHGVSLERKIRVDEYCIKPKNFLFILGTLAENPGLTVSATPVRTISAGEHSVTFHLPGSVGGGVVNALGSMPGATTRSFTFTASKGEVAPQKITRLSIDTRSLGSVDEATRDKIAAAMMKAGITNPDAWAVAGLQYPGVTASPAPDAAAAAPGEDFDRNPKTVLMKGLHQPDFFISWRSQREVVKSLAWKATLMIWGGPLLTLACVYFLALQWGWL